MNACVVLCRPVLSTFIRTICVKYSAAEHREGEVYELKNITMIREVV